MPSGRRWRPGNTKQRDDLGQIWTRERELKISALVLEWILNCAFERQLGLAISDLEIDRIRLVRLPQHQRGAAYEINAQLLALEPAA